MRYARWLALATVFGTPAAARDDPAPYSETYRPQFHFSPKSGWIGDPDGLIHYRGKYHLFWWGHAESTDLVHWEEKPYPMKGGDGSFTYYTGSVVVDEANTSGMGRDGKAPLIAVYTANHRATRRQTQCLSASLDGESFQYFAGNPVLDIGSTAFRDPDVFWHEPTRRWIMAITLPVERKVHFYGSGDLKSWTFLSEFGPIGARDQLWEVPNLLRLPLDGDGSKPKWVLVCGMGPNKAQFFVGDFDGSRFRIDPVQHAFLTTGAGLPGEVFADFEAPDYAGWTPEGDAFGPGPDAGGRPLAGYLGKGLVSTRRAGPKATGRLLSPPFTITRSCINFLIGGGHHPGETCIDLVVDGEVVRTATGRDSDTLMWSGWDVADWKGKRGQLRIVDRHRGDWANITVDHILFSDVLMDQDREQANWIDWGPDFYAVRAWRPYGERDDRTVWMGWMGNWDYARSVPTSWGKGAESIPREVRLASAPGGYRIHQAPIPELAGLRREPSRVATRKIQGDPEELSFRPGRNCYEIEAEFEWDEPGVDVGLNLCVGGTNRTVVGFDTRTSSVYLDRRRSGNVGFAPRFAGRFTAPHVATGNTIKFRVIVDQSSIEVFVDGGKTVLTALIFPDPGDRSVELFARRGTATLRSLSAWELDSIWKAQAAGK